MNKTVLSFNIVSDCCHASIFRQCEMEFPLGGRTWGISYSYEACEVCGEQCGQLQACEGCGEVFNEKGLPSCQCEII